MSVEKHSKKTPTPTKLIGTDLSLNLVAFFWPISLLEMRNDSQKWPWLLPWYCCVEVHSALSTFCSFSPFGSGLYIAVISARSRFGLPLLREAQLWLDDISQHSNLAAPQSSHISPVHEFLLPCQLFHHAWLLCFISRILALVNSHIM